MAVYTEKILIQYLSSINSSTITEYQLGVFLFRLYKTKEFNRKPVLLYSGNPDKKKYNDQVDKFIDLGLLKSHKDFPERTVFNILERKSTAEEIACTVDPFAYLSHLSAMEYHALTNRNPLVLILSSPAISKWKECAILHMKKDLNEDYQNYINSNFPRLRRIGINKIGGRDVRLFRSDHAGSFVVVQNGTLRVAKIGRTFLDMIRQPNLCGGFEHVLDVYQEHAVRYLRLIVDEIDRHGKKIEKVRAGYILTERCGLEHSSIKEWEKCTQRGGSQKLDPTAEYSPEYSERWNLSINTV